MTPPTLMPGPILMRAIYSVATLYMMMILLRWLSPHLELDLNAGKWRWIGRLTDPLIKFIRAKLPKLGPFDYAPIAAVAAVWLIRELGLGLLAPVLYNMR